MITLTSILLGVYTLVFLSAVQKAKEPWVAAGRFGMAVLNTIAILGLWGAI